MCTQVLDFATYSVNFRNKTTFRFHGHRTEYYIKDAAEMDQCCIRFFGKKGQEKKRDIFVFFFLMCFQKPMCRCDTFTVDELMKFGELK